MINIVIKVVPIGIGFLLDQWLGDPYHWPHPIRLIGYLIMKLEKWLRSMLGKHERAAGTYLAAIVLLVSTGIPFIFLRFCYQWHIMMGIIVESILCYYLLAAKCLKDESMKVYAALEQDDLEGARKAVSMIVGRDTESLSEEGIIKAAVETVAENTSDGVTAPLFYMMFGGATLGFFYKAANTLDSMIGYKNERYLQFGRFAAKLDDVLNYIPSRLTALLMILAAYLCRMDGHNAYKMWRRDRYNHASPNSAQTEAVCAGALRLQLAGDAYYFGKLYKKKTIGEPLKRIEKEDIKRANQLMMVTAVLMLIVVILLRTVMMWVR